MSSVKRSYSTTRKMGKKPSTEGAKKRRILRRTDTSTVDTTNQNNTGRVEFSKTDLALNATPFPPKKWVELEYFNSLTPYAPAALIGTMSCKPSDAYDFDNTAAAYYGNKQPLFYDTLLTGTGPYKQFKVWSWVITYTVINLAAGPVQVYGFPTLSAASEMDSGAEMDNYPGVKRLMLTKSGGGKDIGYITIKGALTDVYPYDRHSSSLAGTYNSSPSVPVYGGLGFLTGDGTTQVNVAVAVKCVMHTELGNIDALVS